MATIKNAYGLIERFAVVYMLGIALSLITPIYAGFRMPAIYPQALLALAGLMAAWAFGRKAQRGPKLTEYLLALAGCAAVLLIIKLKVADTFAHTAQMNGPGLLPGMLRRTLWETLTLAVLLSPWFVPLFVKHTQPTKNASRDDAAAPEWAPTQPRAPIPLTVGFANLGAPDLEAWRQQDEKIIGPLFARSMAPPADSVPSAQVLFLYVTLKADGTILGMDGPMGVRQVVQATKADIVVVATDNTPEAVQAAVALPGPKTANIVFTLARRGDLLPRFLADLFDGMRSGDHMLSAWVKLCPQGPAADSPNMPGTILLAEGGKIAFPKAG